MREYSQGSIKSFDVLDTQQDGGIVRVTAKVGVQVDVLHAQLKGALAGAASVRKGLFVQAATEQTQQVNAEAIFIDQIVAPSVRGAGLQLAVGEPTKMDMNNLPCSLRSDQPRCDEAFNAWIFQSQKQNNNVYRIPVTLTAEASANRAMWQTASSISKEPCLRLDLKSDRPFNPISETIDQLRQQRPGSGQDNRYVAVVHRVGNSSVGSACYQVLRDGKSFDAAIANFARLAFGVSVLDKEGVIAEQYLFRPYPSQQQLNSLGSSSAGSPDFRRSFLVAGDFPPGHGYYVFIPPKTQTFDMLIHVPLAVIGKADRMEVKIVAE